MVRRVMTSFGVDNPEQYRVMQVIALSCVVIFPLCLLRSVSNLRYATILSLFSITYTTIILIVELPMYWSSGKASVEKLELFRLDWSIFSAVGVTFFSFMSQTGFYAATERLTKRDAPHLTKVHTRPEKIS